MPIHGWTRVDAGVFHDLHTSWITHIKESLNGGLLPRGYYALAEQHAGSLVADVLTPREPAPPTGGRPFDGDGGVAVVTAPPRVRRRLEATPEATYRRARRTLAIRHVTGHRLVALLEIASPGNKDREKSVEQFVDKAYSALEAGCHVLVVDPLPPGPHDPRGLHGAIWSSYGTPDDVDPAEPLTLASYAATRPPEAYVEPVAVGGDLPAMPLFLDPPAYVNVPLGPTYEAAYRGLPVYWRGVLEGRDAAGRG